MKVCFILFVSMVAAVVAQGPAIGNAGQPVDTGAGQATGGNLGQSAGPGPDPTGTGQVDLAARRQYNQFLAMQQPPYPQQQPQAVYPQWTRPAPSQYMPQQRQSRRQRQRQRQNTFNPIMYYLYQQNDNPLFRYMLLSGRPFNPYLFLLNN